MTSPKFGTMEAVADATAWHDQRPAEHDQAEEFSTCWCCCDYCEVHNPHYYDALGTRAHHRQP